VQVFRFLNLPIASYLVFGTEGVYKFSREIGISETRQLIEGLVGETVMSYFLMKRKVDSPIYIPFVVHRTFLTGRSLTHPLYF
jgi:hypothetical protein